MILFLSLFVAIVGLLMYGFCKDGKLVEVGRIMFWVGLLCFLLGDNAVLTFLRK